MRFKVAKSDLKVLLEMVNKFPKKWDGYIIFKGVDGKLYVEFILSYYFQIKMIIRWELSGSVDREGEVVIWLKNFKSLKTFLKSVRDLVIVFEQEGDILKVNDVVSIDLDDLKNVPAVSEELFNIQNVVLTLEANFLLDNLVKLLKYIPSDKVFDFKTYFKSLCIDSRVGELNFVTSDTKKLFCCSYRLENEQEGKILLPYEVCQILVPLLKRYALLELFCEFRRQGERSVILTEKFQILFDWEFDEYADYYSILRTARGYSYESRVKKSELEYVLKLFSSNSEVVTLEFMQDKLIIQTDKNPPQEIECIYSSESLRIHFNLKFLLEVLSFFKDAEMLTFRFRDKTSAIYVSAQNNYEALLMPLNLD